jgi:hypothetical protein
LNSPPRHPRRKGGGTFGVDRTVMPVPTDRLPDKSEFYLYFFEIRVILKFK